MLLDQIHTQLPQRPAPIRQTHLLRRLFSQPYHLAYLGCRNATRRTATSQLLDGFQSQSLERMQIRVNCIGMDSLRHSNLQGLQSHPIQDQRLGPPSLMWINQLEDAFTQLLDFSSRWTMNFQQACHDNTSLSEACHSNSNLWTNSHIN